MDYLKEYLSYVKKRSDNTYMNTKSILNEFFGYVKKKPEDITIQDVFKYFKDYLDKKPLKNTSKSVARYTLKKFFDFIISNLIQKNILFQNPVPSNNIFEFSTKAQDIPKQSEKIEQEKALTNDQIDEILTECRMNCKYRDFILILLAVSTGARISELRTLRKSNINFKERYLETGFDKNARKSYKFLKTGLLFFFSHNVEIYLKNYILTLPEDQDYVFCGQFKHRPITYDTAKKMLQKVCQSLEYNVNWHDFRRTLITKRREMGCEEGISEMLMNHKSSSTENAHYVKYSIKKKRELYDNYFPYEELKYL